jgi:hypothetical protein
VRPRTLSQHTHQHKYPSHTYYLCFLVYCRMLCMSSQAGYGSLGEQQTSVIAQTLAACASLSLCACVFMIISYLRTHKAVRSQDCGSLILFLCVCDGICAALYTVEGISASTIYTFSDCFGLGCYVKVRPVTNAYASLIDKHTCSRASYNTLGWQVCCGR